MPLYEYRCKKCGARFERIQKFSDAPLAKCEKCGGKLEQLLSSPAIQFKGTGWYVTDYARKPSPAGESGGEGSSPASGPTSGSDGGGKAERSPAGKRDASAADKPETSTAGKKASSPVKKKDD